MKSAAVTAFRSSYRHAGDRWLGHYSPMDRARLALTSLEVIADALLEIMEVCFEIIFVQLLLFLEFLQNNNTSTTLNIFLYPRLV